MGRRYLFERAERLSMTVAELSARMSSAELTDWMALDALRGAEAEKAERLAKKGMRSR